MNRIPAILGAACALVLAILPCSEGLKAQNISCDFTQVRTIKASGKKVTSKGAMTFTRPDQLVMQYSQPEGDFFIIDGPVVRMFMYGNESSIDTSRNPRVRLQQQTLLGCLTGDCEKVAKDNNADLTETQVKGFRKVTISVREKVSRGYTRIAVTYDKRNIPVCLELEEAGGIVNTYTLENIVVN